MTPETAKTQIEEVIRKIRTRLEQAAAVARSAEACIDAGNPAQALTIVFDAALPIYEATTFLNAASLMKGERTPE